MIYLEALKARSGAVCELCGSSEAGVVYEVPPTFDGSVEQSVLLCERCSAQVSAAQGLDGHHLRCLTESMWSEVPAVQVVAWRLLSKLSTEEDWARDLLDTLFLDETVQIWAEALEQAEGLVVKHLDSNGTLLETGDTVTLIKDLDVKGANFVAKRGTSVRSITLVHNNAEQIEGRVSGQRIVILTQFVKKAK